MAAEQKPALKMRFCIETNNILYPSACASGEGAGGRARERLALTPACPPTHPAFPASRAGEDKAAKKLLWCSRLVDYTEEAGTEAEDNCVYRQRYAHDQSEKTVVFEDVRADPTLPRTKDQLCPKCGNREAVFFSSHTPEGMTLWFQCMSCGQKWKDAV